MSTIDRTPVKIPTKVPLQVARPTQSNIPSTRPEREALLRIVRDYVQTNEFAPPLPTDELRVHAKIILNKHNIDEKFTEYTGILFNNELWRDYLATIPYERRLLLMPKCLRVEKVCPAPFDEFGLLCKQCGACSIQDLQNEAERLGYAVLVAEGSAIVMKIIESGKIEAIVGVSCISVLEKAFPYMEMAAIPGIAIPLLQDDCKDTNVDMEWVWDVIHLTSDDKSYRLDLDEIRDTVGTWFQPDGLAAIMGEAKDPVSELAQRWMAKDGKRWRPFLTTSVVHAVSPELVMDGYSDDLKKLAIAVECFHKASLIHDDIEDDDATRYGEPTLHEEVGMPIALNVGDFLVGEGYRLIGDADIDPSIKAKILTLAARGHSSLSIGQGRELAWRQNPGPIAERDVLGMFREKTAPAFDVAIRMGGLFAQASDEVLDIMEVYSESIGIAYQINDDLSDISSLDEGADLVKGRPSLALSIAYKDGSKENKEELKAWWAGSTDVTDDRIREIVKETQAITRMEVLKESFKQQAIDALLKLQDPSLKGLLRRVVSKIFNDIVIKGWCNEFEATNASSGELSATPAE